MSYWTMTSQNQHGSKTQSKETQRPRYQMKSVKERETRAIQQTIHEASKRQGKGGNYIYCNML